MRFNLVYEEPLQSQGADNKFDKKWKMRQYLHTQLGELWKVHPGLKQRAGYMSKRGYLGTATDHLDPEVPNAKLHQHSVWERDLQAPIEIGGIKFLPLIRESFALACSLRILFMRKESAGRVHQGGDLAKRIKAFIEALKVPMADADKVASVYPKPIEPIRCLLEDDASITRLSVESTRLLDAPRMEDNSVRMVVEVDARITRTGFYYYSVHGYRPSYRG